MVFTPENEMPNMKIPQHEMAVNKKAESQDFLVYVNLYQSKSQHLLVFV